MPHVQSLPHRARSAGKFPDPATVAIGLTVAAAVVAPSLDRGGFTGGGQKLLIIASAAALVEVVLLRPDALTTALRSLVVPILLLLGVLAMLSAFWTIGATGTAIRWGLVIVAYGAVAVTSGVLTMRAGPVPIATGISILAVLEAALGLGSAALHQGSWAELIGGSWRPGGSYQYAAALGLLQVCGLPAALRAAASTSPGIAGIGALALALAGATLGCADSRIDLALAAATLLFLGVFASQAQLPRRDLLTATGLLAVAAVAGALLIGRHTEATAHGGGAARTAAIAAACSVLAAAWPLLRRLAGRIALPRLALVTALALAVVAAIWLLAGYASTLTSTGGGLGHGRSSYWTAAVKAWMRRPVFGSGAGTFYQASIHYQVANDRTLFAHNLPLELAAELGLCGLFLGLCLYAAVASTLWRTIRAPNAWLLAPTVGCFLLANLVDWPWHLAGLGAAWAAAAGGLSRTATGSRGLASNASRARIPHGDFRSESR